MVICSKCEKCEKSINEKDLVWLEFSMNDGRFYLEFPKDHDSQGYFPFCKICAKKMTIKTEKLGPGIINPDKEDEMRKHYQKLKIQPDFYSAENDLGWREGNVIKYVTRYKLKGTPMKDLLKARDYLNRIIRDFDKYNKPLFSDDFVESCFSKKEVEKTLKNYIEK